MHTVCISVYLIKSLHNSLSTKDPNQLNVLLMICLKVLYDCG